jgi:hypothetical protein
MASQDDRGKVKGPIFRAARKMPTCQFVVGRHFEKRCGGPRSRGLLGEEVLDLVGTESEEEDGDERGNKVEFGELVERSGV